MLSRICILLLIAIGAAFAPVKIPRPTVQLSATSKKIADFEYAEMRANLEAMERQRVPSRALDPAKRAEIESYVRAVASDRPSAIPLKQIATVLPGTEWRLGFSTELAALGDLPKDADVKLEFHDDSKLDYILEFSEKTLGLNRLVAKSSYEVDTSDINPGLVTFVYDEIVTDVFGFKNVGVGFFGLLKGRANNVETVFMDNRFWIERGFSPEGQEYFNVYLRKLEPAKQLGDQWD
jgi:hypothetical protein